MAQRLLPLAEASGGDLPMPRLLRLALFQVSVGMAAVLLTGTLNRVMIVELGVPTTLVALMVALPVLAAPFRALIGYRSDRFRSFLGWRRVPFIWVGSLLQFGGFAIMPFALIILSGDTQGPVVVGQWAAALAFALVGIGMHTTQTVGLALASDLATEKQRPYVVALLFVMLLLGMLVSALLFGGLLQSFSQFRLIQVVQGAAVLTLVLNVVAVWRQEVRRPVTPSKSDRRSGSFSTAWRALLDQPGSKRLLVAVAFGTSAFTMQDILLEPFGADVLGLTVDATTRLTALFAGGMLTAFLLAASWLGRGIDPHRLAGYGALFGVVAFALLSCAAMLASRALFPIATLAVGFAAGLFAVGTLVAAMQLATANASGLVLGAWGAVQATAVGVATIVAGAIHDAVESLASAGHLGDALTSASTGYAAVYQIEIVFLFVTLAVIGPLARLSAQPMTTDDGLGLSEFPASH
ncbi:MAG: BCD family MFS transporter [Pseudomonadota bacterium]